MPMDLGKQVGPLPLGAWIVVVGGGLGLAYYGYTRSAPTDAGTSAGIEQGVGDGSVGGFTPTAPSGGNSSSVDTGVVATNEAWGVRAINWLIAEGYNGAVADSAIRKYLAGNDPAPSIQEFVLQTLALQHFGSPPNPLPPPLTPPPSITPTPTPTTPPPATGGGAQILPSVTPVPPSQAPGPVGATRIPPAPSPAPSVANVRWYVVKAWPLRGSSLWSIAQMFYGNGSQYPRIFNANKVGVRRPDGTMGMISNPNVIRAGWRLYIP